MRVYWVSSFALFGQFLVIFCELKVGSLLSEQKKSAVLGCWLLKFSHCYAASTQFQQTFLSIKATAIDLKQGYGFLSFETEQDAEDCYAERFDAKIGVFFKK